MKFHQNMFSISHSEYNRTNQNSLKPSSLNIYFIGNSVDMTRTLKKYAKYLRKASYGADRKQGGVSKLTRILDY